MREPMQRRPRASVLSSTSTALSRPATAIQYRLDVHVLLSVALAVTLAACCAISADGAFVPCLALLTYLCVSPNTFDALPRTAARAVRFVALTQLLGSLLLNAFVLFTPPHTQRSGSGSGADDSNSDTTSVALSVPWLRLLMGLRQWQSIPDAVSAIVPPVLLLLLLPLHQRQGRGLNQPQLQHRWQARASLRVARWRTVWGLSLSCVVSALCVPSLAGALLFLAAPALFLTAKAADVRANLRQLAVASHGRGQPMPLSQAPDGSSRLPSSRVAASVGQSSPPNGRRLRVICILSSVSLVSMLVTISVVQSVANTSTLALIFGPDATAYDGGVDSSAVPRSCPLCSGSAVLSVLRVLSLAAGASLSHALVSATSFSASSASGRSHSGNNTVSAPPLPEGVEDEHASLLHTSPPREQPTMEPLRGEPDTLNNSSGRHHRPSHCAASSRQDSPLHTGASADGSFAGDGAGPVIIQRRVQLQRWLLHGSAVVAVLLMTSFPSAPSCCLLALTALQSLMAGRSTGAPRLLVLLTLSAFGTLVTVQYVITAAARLGMVPTSVVQLFISQAAPFCGERATPLSLRYKGSTSGGSDPRSGQGSASHPVFLYSVWAATQLLLNALVLLTALCAYLFAGPVTAPTSSTTNSAVTDSRFNLAGMPASGDYSGDYARLTALLGAEKAGQLYTLAQHIDRMRSVARAPGDEGLATLFAQLTGRLPTPVEERRLLRGSGAEMLENRAGVAAAAALLASDSNDDGRTTDDSDSNTREELRGRQWRRGALLALQRPLSLCLLLGLVLCVDAMDALHAVGALLLICFTVFPTTLFRRYPRAPLLYATGLVLAQLVLSFLLINGLIQLPERVPGTTLRMECLVRTAHLSSHTLERVVYLLAAAGAQQLLLLCFNQCLCRSWADTCTHAELRISLQCAVGHHYSVGLGSSVGVVVVNMRRALSTAALGALLLGALCLGLWWPPSALHAALLVMALALAAAKAWRYHRLAVLVRLGLINFLAWTACGVTLGGIPAVAEVVDALAQQFVSICKRTAASTTSLSTSCVADAGLVAPATYLGQVAPALYLCVWHMLLLLGATVRADSAAATAEDDESEALVVVEVAGPAAAPQAVQPGAPSSRGVPSTAAAASSPSVAAASMATTVHGLPLPHEEPFLYDCIYVFALVKRVVVYMGQLAEPYLAVWLSWLSCASAALTEPCILNGVYMLGFAADLSASLFAAYNLRHLVAVYVYQLNFVPPITATFRGIGGSTTVPVDAMVGLVKQRFNDGQRHDGVNEEDPLPALAFCWRQTLVALAMLLRAATVDGGRAKRSSPRVAGPAWQPTTNWWQFLGTQAVPLFCFDALCLTLLGALGSAQTSAEGVAFAAALAVTVAAGRYRLVECRSLRLVVWMLLGLCALLVLLVRLDAVIHVLPLATSESSEGFAPWRQWLWEAHGTTAIARLAVLSLAMLHQYRRCAAPVASLAAQSRAAYAGHVYLIDYVKAQGISGGLLSLTRDRLSLAIPDTCAMEPGSCSSRVLLMLVRVVAYSYPVALTSFLAGAASPPSVLSALLLVGSLLLAAHAESVHLNFYRSWRIIALLYSGIPLIALASQLPGGVGEWMQRNTGWVLSLSDGLSGAFTFSSLHIALLFTVVLQTTVYNSYYYGAVVRHLYQAATTRGERYVAMQQRLQDEGRSEVQRVAQHDAELQQRLLQLRRTGCAAAASSPKREEDLPSAAVSVPAAPGINSPAKPTASSLPSSPITAGGGGMHSRRAQSGLDQVIDFFARRTFRPAACTPAAVPHRGHRLAKAFALFLVRHTAFAVLAVTAANALYTGCLWEVLALCYLLTVALVLHPFAPRAVYQVYLMYVVVGIALKASASVYVERVVLHQAKAAGAAGAGRNGGVGSGNDWYESSRFLRALSWLLLDVSKGDGSYYWGRSANYMLAFLDFLSFAVAGVHQSVCLWEGVYKPAVPPEPHPSSPSGGDEVPGFDLGRPSGEDDAGEEEDIDADGISDDPLSFFYPTSQRLYGLYRGMQATDRTHDNFSDAPERCCESSNALCVAVNSLRSAVGRLWSNMVRVHGVGREYYALYTTVDAVALAFLLLFYGHLTGNDAITLQVNVSNNLLPGPLAALLSLSVLQLVLERAVYVRNCMAAKVVCNYVWAVGYCLGYWLWRHSVPVHSTAAGNAYFLLKILSLTLSVWQVRSGFPRHRRHDPFTPFPGSTWRFYGYQAVRLVPFLWEARTFIDWTMQRTSLRLEEYMKTEELYDTVYRRRVQLSNLRRSNVHLGRPVSAQSKWTVGASRVLLILVAVLGPLLYYSSLNPSVSASEAAQVRLQLSFTGGSPFFTSITRSTVSTPKEYRSWLVRTRPTLSTYGVLETERTMQLMQLAMCSSDLWLVSPEALRLTTRQLREAASGNSTMYILQTLELVKKGHMTAESGATAGGATTEQDDTAADQVTVQLSTSSWPLPAETAATLLSILERHGPQQSLGPQRLALHQHTMPDRLGDRTFGSRAALSSHESQSGAATAGANLTRFYTPFVFSRGSDLQQLATPNGRNRVGCELQLHLEVDAALQTPVRYWCLACDPLFTSGNVPVDNDELFPERRCLFDGRDCDQHNREDSVEAPTAADARTPFYTVVLSDPVVGGVSFLKRFGLAALYTTFVLALGRLMRSVFTGNAQAMIQADMADPTAVGQLIESINIARDCGELALEQTGYLALVDLMRSPERLLEMTGARRDLFNARDGALQMPQSFIENEVKQRWLRCGEV